MTTTLFQKYYPIEQDPNINIEDKLNHLNDWWKSDLALFIKAGFNKTDFAHMMLTSKLIFRKGTNNLLNLCKEIDLPIIVLSGGIHELIDASFKILK